MDAIAITATLAVTLVARLALSEELANLSVQVAAFTALMALMWFGSLFVTGAYDPRFLGAGPEEYKKVATATVVAFGLVATASFLLRFDISRAFVLVAFPVGLTLLLSGRRLARALLHQARGRGDHLAPTLVIGTDAQIARLTHSLDSSPVNGFRVAARLNPPAADEPGRTTWLDDAVTLVTDHGIQAVAVAQSDGVDAALIRELAWRLEGPGIDLLVDPGITDIAGPRLTFRPAADLALVHLDEPQFTGPKRALKRLLDLVAAGAALILLSPVMAVLYVIVKVTSPGPGLFVQTRVGQFGKPFRMYKFRTMKVGAEAEQAGVWATAGTDNNKAKDDPRITPCGRWMRRWSLDELPQLFNVLGGSMSVVGPRPIQTSEANSLMDWQVRRHLTKPGLTGLWQISGRSDTTWDERMRLDLIYIERWSPSLDLVIGLKTVRVVLAGRGAY